MADSRRSRSRERGARNYIEARPKDTYFREDYGWIMSDAQVAEEQRTKTEIFDKNIADTENQIANARDEYSGARDTGIGKINSAYDAAIAKAGGTTKKIRVVKGNTVEATYVVPAAYANEYAKSKDLFTAWNGGFLNVDVKAKGGSTVGSELHTALTDAVKKYNKATTTSVANLNKQRAAEIATFNTTTDKSLGGQEKVWGKTIASAKNAYGNRVKDGAEMYQDSRKNYNDSIRNMNMGLLETPTNQVNTGAIDGNQIIQSK